MSSDYHTDHRDYRKKDKMRKEDNHKVQQRNLDDRYFVEESDESRKNRSLFERQPRQNLTEKYQREKHQAQVIRLRLKQERLDVVRQEFNIQVSNFKQKAQLKKELKPEELHRQYIEALRYAAVDKLFPEDISEIVKEQMRKHPTRW